MNYFVKIILAFILFYPNGKNNLRAVVDLSKLKKAGSLIKGPDKSFQTGPQWAEFLESTRGVAIFEETL